MRTVLNLYPPFIGAGIRIKRLDADWRTIEVEMKLRRWNANYVGTHYGGSLYSMTDPFYMLMLIENLGREYIVWDKSACIRFRRPAKGTVRASFSLSEARIDEIRTALQAQESSNPPLMLRFATARERLWRRCKRCCTSGESSRRNPIC